MPGRSPKRKGTARKDSRKEGRNLKTASDDRLFIVLGGAILIAIAVIGAIYWTTPA